MAETREKRITALTEALVQRPGLLGQYSIWLENSEAHTRYEGEDVYNRLVGAMQALTDVDFIPGTGWRNFVEVTSRLQKETGLDLGVCEYLNYKSDGISECMANTEQEVLVGSFKCCIPPERSRCKYRHQ